MQYDAGVHGSHGGFFPDVGIQPVTDGGLFAAGLFVAERLGLALCRPEQSNEANPAGEKKDGFFLPSGQV